MWSFICLISLFVICVQSVCKLPTDENVKHLDIRIPEQPVPQKLTHYVCQQFKVPDDQDYNAIAFEGLIANPGVVHHVLVFGCDFDVDIFEPHECGTYDGRCRSWLAQWTIGVYGKTCTYPDTGIRFGKNSYKYMSIQIHWNNYNLDSNLTDNSGIRLHYTDKLRKNEVGNVQIGQNDLEIPVRSDHFLKNGSCSETCTQRMLPHPIYLTKTYIHMHNLGVAGKFEIYRNGRLIREIAHDSVYNYHKSPIHFHDPPVEVRPGDEVKLSCWFTSGDKNHTIYWGEGSDAEMCYAFVSYYPKVKGFDQCIQFDEYDVNCNVDGELYMGGCTMEMFESDLQTDLIQDIQKTCKADDMCVTSCSAAIQTLTEHPCFNGRFKDYSVRLFPPKIPGWNAVMDLLERHYKSCS
ncbi:dopamine beta-hydroxylase-like [Mytilus trossulus]|uniref:dopamine beta-hydroxylase-like n=1 Tax=Mytilus trossulus TaxID=6551 RepID=UPI00300736F0